MLGPGAFRLILALLVLVSHLSRFGVGRPAVMAFFMLSGYWVCRMYAERYLPPPRAPLGAHVRAASIFTISRLLRVGLPFAGIFLLGAAAYSLVVGPSAPAYRWESLGLLGNATRHLHGPTDVVGVSWSLDIEIQFYALVPFLLILMRTDLGTLLLLVGAQAAFAFGWLFHVEFGVATVFAYLPWFLLGMLIWRTDYRPRTVVVRATVGLFLTAVAIMAGVPQISARLAGSGDPVTDLGAMALTALLVPFIAQNVHTRSGRLDQHFGALSYVLYLVQIPTIIVVRHLVDGSATPKPVLLVAVLVMAVAAYAAVDRPSEALRRRVVRTLERQWLRPRAKRRRGSIMHTGQSHTSAAPSRSPARRTASHDTPPRRRSAKRRRRLTSSAPKDARV